MFNDRLSAGKQLARRLSHYRGDVNAVVLGLPRGGIVTAYAIAKELHLPLDLIGVRKIGAPFNRELAIGAIAEKGEGYFDEHLIESLGVSKDYIARTVENEKRVILQRLKQYREHCPKYEIEGKTVILVDDGLATGATMKAAIKSVHAEGADRIVVAVPVAPPDTADEIRAEVDETVCLETPPFFAAVGQFYEEFSQVEDEEVIALLRQSRRPN